MNVNVYGAPAWLAGEAWTRLGDAAMNDKELARRVRQAFSAGDSLVFFPLPLEATVNATQKQLDHVMRRTRASCTYAVAAMRQRGFGRLVLVAPSFPILAPEFAAGWQFSSWLVGLARGLALEAAAQGVTVNAVLVAPPAVEAADWSAGDFVWREDVEHAVWLFLDCDAGYLTGQVMHLCAGRSMVSIFSH